MPSSHSSRHGHITNDQQLRSKDMPALPDNFAPVFFQNQFRTKIELPSKEKYPDVKGQCAIITGCNTGLGFEAARQLLSLGLSRLVMGVRSLEKGNAAAQKLRPVNDTAHIDVWELDMELYDSIQTFVRRCESELSSIDIVILNSGLSPLKSAIVPATGYEKAIQVNYMSTVFLTTLLLPVLKSKTTNHGPPRLTVVNSVMSQLCKFPNQNERPLLKSFNDVTVTPWSPPERYGVSKLLGQLFIVKLADMINPNDVIINMVDPGLTKGTALARDATGLIGVAASIFNNVAGRPVDRAAATYLDAVFGHGQESHGCFLMNCKIAPLSCWFYKGGNELSNQVWTETLEEFRFAQLERIIASMRE